MRCSRVLALLGAFESVTYVRAATNYTPEALDPALTNKYASNGAGPVLYYNGSGPVPGESLLSPIPSPITPLNSSKAIEDAFYAEIIGIVNTNATYSTGCDKCMAAMEVMHLAAITQPVSTVTDLLIRACEAIPAFYDTIYASTCEREFSSIGGLGPYYAQLFSKMSAATGDFQALCYFYYETCEQPPTVEIDESLYFSEKPASASKVPEPSGQELNVLHISDWHLDPRYDIGSEANCSQYLCCRPDATNSDLDTTAVNASLPASRFGYLYCDSPPDLALSSFDDMKMFFDTSNVSFAIFTGDIVSHDNDDQLSRAYVEYEEKVTYETFKAMMNDTPIYPTLGNHDSLPEAYNSQDALDPTSSDSSNALSWNYDLLSSMWESDGWLKSSEESYASTHYGAYAHSTSPHSLLVIIAIFVYLCFCGIEPPALCE
jgi:sphingomyelin phosphodiesterase